MKYLVYEDTIMWAFRYALGRRTGAVNSVIDTLREHWDNLTVYTKKKIQEEIEEAIRLDNAGSKCDIKSWQEILELVVIEKI